MSAPEQMSASHPARNLIRLVLCGDVMTGRGIDQILPHPCNPTLHESYAHSALDYVHLAEELNGPIPRQVDPSYVWGEALRELDRRIPDVRIVNLETSITRSEEFAPKGINYRMSQENAACLSAAHIDCCVLANNHVLDWGRTGLLDTLTTLERLGIKVAGAGRNFDDAETPAVLETAGKGRVVVFAFASTTSGTPRSWTAKPDAPGINVLSDLSEMTAVRIADQIARVRQPGDVIVVSLHWGANWGFEIPEEQRRFAHTLIDQTGASIVYGHSSHHAKAMEVYHNRLILYGCGDFLNDYEGIAGYDEYRDDLGLLYCADVEPESGALAALEIVPLHIRKFQLVQPSSQDMSWVQQTLDGESRRCGTRVMWTADGRLAVS